MVANSRAVKRPGFRLEKTSVMDRRHRLILITFIESFGTVMLERGLYFYTHGKLGFSEAANLWLALAFGIVYVAGAMASHPVAERFGERRALVWTIIVSALMHLSLVVWRGPVMLAVMFPLIGLINGLKWPIVESYVSAGMTPRNTLRILGRFNVSWAGAVPLAVAASGPLVEYAPWLLFAGPVAINLVTLYLIRRLRPRPMHLPHDHPERLSDSQTARYRALVTSGRWSLLGSYAMLFLLAPLMPRIFADLGLNVQQATNLASLLDVVRVSAFALLGWLTIWHGRVLPLVGVLIVLPGAFFMVLFGQSVPVVLLGELLFGAGSGLTYFAALYYAMVVKNASVDAGGVHESLIGMGFALGPAVGLIGLTLADFAGGYVQGMLLGVGPMLVICAAGALWPLVKMRQLDAQRDVVSEPAG